MHGIRPYRNDDEAAVTAVWVEAGRRVYGYLPQFMALSIDEARAFLGAHVLTRLDVWVGTEGDEVVAYLAMDGSYIDRLYVRPDRQGRGWGRRLLDFAKARSKTLSLHTHQANEGARAFYEASGFVAVAFGVSPPPESLPDVEYRWDGGPELRPRRTRLG